VLKGEKMKTLIIYKSVHQMNTEKVAKAMAEAINADLRKVEEVTPAMLAEYDLPGGPHHSSGPRLYSSPPIKRLNWRISVSCLYVQDLGSVESPMSPGRGCKHTP